MPVVESEPALLRNPRLAALATSARPAWLWSADASRILWANAVGAALFGAADSAACAKRVFDLKNPSAAQIIRLAATLPSGGASRLERLRGFGAGFGRVLTCACARLEIADGRAAVLVAAIEPAGPALSLAERVRRLFVDDGQAAAIFAPDGTLLHATRAAQECFGKTTSLAALGLDTVAARAMATGSANATVQCGEASHAVDIERLGEDASRVVVVTFALQPATDAASPPSQVDPQVDPPDDLQAERRHPLRFVWQMDADGRFLVGSDEFIELMGPRTGAAFGRMWRDIAAELNLDPADQVVRAVATHETWSGIVISWPADGSSEPLPVELSGLPVFDRDRTYRGYRGFGVCRDIDRINQLARARRAPIGFMPAPMPSDGGGAVMPPAVKTTVPSETPSVEAAVAGLADASPRVERPMLSVAPTSANVVLFRPGHAAEAKPPTLSPVERKAFRELAQELTARLRGTHEAPAVVESAVDNLSPEQQRPIEAPADAVPDSVAAAVPLEADGVAAERNGASAATDPQQRLPIEPLLLDRIPAAVLIYRHDALLYANRHFLERSGYDSLGALAAAGGPNSLFAEPTAEALAASGGAQSLSIKTRSGERLAVEGRLFTVPWNGASALALIFAGGQTDERQRAIERSLAAAEIENRELKSNRDSAAAAHAKTEDDLRSARRELQKVAAVKAEFLAKVSHEIRTPLNAITGFAEIIITERFGAIGNERYREYLKDILAAGTHLVALLNDLLDLSKVETGQLDLTFTNINLNDLTQQCVGIMQPQANRARIIIRTSLTAGLLPVVADERSLRQIVLNLLANAIRFTDPGGQVIVSTALSDNAEVVLRVRDTGAGLSEKDIEALLEPFRQAATSRPWGSGGTGLGLLLTKALAEANRAIFTIQSAPNAGTLVAITFPRDRVAAQ